MTFWLSLLAIIAFYGFILILIWDEAFPRETAEAKAARLRREQEHDQRMEHAYARRKARREAWEQ